MNLMGERIYELRKQNNMSQGDLADKLDVSRQTVSKWENNSSIPEVEKLLQLSEIFGVSTDYIIKGKAKDKTELASTQITEKVIIVEKKKSLDTKRSVAIGLLVLAAIIVLIIPGLFFVSLWLVAVAAFILFGKKYGLYFATWFTFISGNILFMTSNPSGMLAVFDSLIYSEGYLRHLAVTYSLWILFFVLIVWTVVIIRNRRNKK